MNKKLFSFFLLLGLLLVLNPYKNAYAVTENTVAEAKLNYEEYKSTLTKYIEYIRISKTTGSTHYVISDFGNYADNVVWKFETVSDGSSIYPYLPNVQKVNVPGVKYVVKTDGKLDNNLLQEDHTFTGNDKFTLTTNSSGWTQTLISIKNVNIEGLPSDILPIPPSISDEGQFGYEFELPKNKENINLHVGNSISVKVPFRVKAKNYYALGTNKATEFITDNFMINNYKTEVTNITWVTKPDILGMSKSSTFYIDGFYYINTSTLPSKDTLTANIYNPTQPWLEGSVNVTYSYDGSQPSYNPSVEGGTGGSIDNEGNVNIGGTDYGEMPSAPGEDGSMGDWFQYIGSLLLWLVTYPFKLLGQMVSTLTGYITNMFGILTPVTRQLNDVLSFVPVDILNVCWGFLSFTILYSVLKSVFKMIRG